MRRGVVVTAIAAVVAACNAIDGAGDLEIAAPAAGDAGTRDASGDAPGPPAPPAAPPPPTAGDAGGDARADADAGPPLCDPADPSLVLCFPFDADLLDHAASPASVAETNVTFLPGRNGNGAAFDGTTSTMTIAQGVAKVDAITTAVTIEAFVQLGALPASGARMGILDCDGRFGIFVLSTGLECTGSGVSVVGPKLAIGATSHVACTISQAGVALYVDGAQVATGAGNTLVLGSHPIGIGQNAPSGDTLLGVLDELRVYSRARTAAEILEDAKR